VTSRAPQQRGLLRPETTHGAFTRNSVNSDLAATGDDRTDLGLPPRADDLEGAAGAYRVLGPTGNGTLAEAVAQRVRAWIFSGELKPGSRIRLAETAQRLGVSVMPIRDALRVLEAEQLVTLAPQRGARVSELSVGDIEELYAVRSGLEGLAARLAVTMSDEATDDELQRLFEAMAEAHREGSVEGFMEADRRFHRTLYAIPERDRLLKRITDLWNNSARSVPLVYRSWVLSRSALESHRIILSAVLARDPAAAERFTREHTDQAATRILAAIAESGTTPRRRRATRPIART
jgi:DNA-binding GntR family transcriptional regulator